MSRRALLVALGLSAAIGSPMTVAQTVVQTPAQTSAPPVGELKSLGQERFQIGRIVVDKRKRSFTVPGRVHALDKPLEYLATSPGGRKAYESLLELDASGSEFNLACILIGLERDPNLPSSKPPVVPAGQRVAISMAWSEAGQRRQITAAEALFNTQARAKVETVEWAYTGSFTSRDGSQFAADHTGNLITFIRDPTGILEAVSSTGLGPYGAMRGSSLLPREGSAIELIVEATVAAK